ncbi:MAG TPA: hypothetical protein VNI78_09325 [Vicinamibacterales bacterium]|nr:hypothetical protein [Vicinamibacterales bacterium]
MTRFHVSVAAAVAAVVVAAAHAGAQVPRTPWGDPDLQGDYTNKYEQGTPFERPDEFEGRRIEDITPEEFARIRQERQDRVLLQAVLAGGDQAGNLGGPLHWQDFFDVTKGSRPWFVIDPPDGKIPPTTAEARRRAAARAEARRGRGNADSWIDRSLYDRCITRGLPGSMMPAIYGNSYRIVQAPGVVAIQYEMVHETRIIPLDGRPRAGREIRQHMGDARGWWEGDTLVVETTNFRDESAYRGANADTLAIIERFTPIAPDRLEWRVTVVDPETWERPWTFAMPLTRNPDEAIVEYACHEGNRAMANILSAARAEEQAIEEARRRGITLAPREIPTAAEGER